MRLFSLGSGSSGNAFILDTGQVAWLIDCGVGARVCQAALRDLGVEGRLTAVVLSHEHVDHVRAVESVLRRRSETCEIVTTSGTYAALRREGAWSRRVAGERLVDGAVEISFVGVSHDAAEPCGFNIECDGTRIAIFTDLGYVTDEVLESLRHADIIVLEANYDPVMLERGGYPRHLKRRIQGPAGHLSNDDCAAAMAASVSSRTRGIWLAHLSHNNNTPERARGTVEEALTLTGVSVPVGTLPRYERTEITALPARQLQLLF